MSTAGVRPGRRRTAGAVLGVLGLLAALAGAWQLWGTAVQTHRAQRALESRLEGGTGAAPAGPSVTTAVPAVAAPPARRRGDPLGVLRIPRLGRSWQWVVVEGADRRRLADGPGHVPGTAWPTDAAPGGPVVVAGHRVTHAQPFGRLDRLRRGDEVTLTTGGRTYRWRVTGSDVVRPDAVEVLDGPAGVLRLVTCTPRFSSTHRLVVEAEPVR